MSDRLDAAVVELVAAIRAEVALNRHKPPGCMTVNEAAEALRVSRAQLYKLLSDGSLRSLHVGRRRLVPASAIEEFLESPMG